MKNITLEATNNTPYVSFNTDGHLILKGRSFPRKAHEIYDPIIECACKLTSSHVVCDINLEYINTASTKKILEILQHFENNSKIQSIVVNWYFEEGDEDSVEIAEIYEDKLTRSRFTYNEYAEV